MTAPNLIVLKSAAELRRHAPAWDDLWRRSDTDSPSTQAELVAHWVDTFAAKKRFRAVVVEHAGQFVAALPLIERRVKGMFSVAALPQNDWTSGGDLLVDPAADCAAALACLTDGLATLPWPLLWLDEVAFDSPRWNAFLTTLRSAGADAHVQAHYDVPVVAINHDWNAYVAKLPGDHRRSRMRYARKFNEAGPTELRFVTRNDDALPDEIRRAFEIEDHSWKGTEGTSVLKTPGLIDYFQAQGARLAANGQLELVYLMHQGEAVAFAYCWRAKGVRFIAKLGYDDRFRQLGPGQHLVMLLLERLHADSDCRLLDFWGKLCPWNEAWSTGAYSMGRVVIAPRRLLGRGLLKAYRFWQSRRHPSDNAAAELADAPAS